MEKRICKNCDRTLGKNNKSGYCSGCVAKQIAMDKTQKTFDNWLTTGDLGLSVLTTVRGTLRAKLLDYYGNKCSICEAPSTWNGQPLVLVLDHINGDASDDSKENLRFVCPNCDSQLDTYKSKNKKSKRQGRKSSAVYKSSKEVTIDGITYPSRAQASRALGVAESTIYRKLANNEI